MIDPTQVVTSGSLLVFSGVVTAMLRNHDLDIKELKKSRDDQQQELVKARIELARIATKEGIRE